MTNLIRLLEGGRDVEQFDPERYRLKQAALDYGIEEARRLQDWPMLEKAVDIKIDEQRKFIGWRNAHIRGVGQPQRNADRSVGILSSKQITDFTGITEKQAERISAKLAEPEKYRERLLGAAYCAAFLEPQGRSGINTGVAQNPHDERGLDLYETPPAAVRALLDVERLAGTIWEPACGPGAIVRMLRAAGHRVVATDIADYGCPDSTSGVDFLTTTCAPLGVTTILTNPPFRVREFVRNALTLAPRVIILQRLLFLESEGRSDILDDGQLARVHVFRNRLQIHRDGWPGPHARSPLAMAWFVWDRDHSGPPTLHRISWSAEAAITNGGAR
jgi:hypothetical protein